MNIYRQYFSTVEIILHRNRESHWDDETDLNSASDNHLSIDGNTEMEQPSDTNLNDEAEQTSNVADESEGPENII